MKFPFGAFILDTSFKVKSVTIANQSGESAYVTDEGRVVQEYEIFKDEATAAKFAKSQLDKIQSQTDNRRGMGG